MDISPGKNRPKPMQVTYVYLHKYPDLDAVAAYWLAKRHPEIFVGIESAKLKLIPQDSNDPSILAQLDQIGSVAFDVGGGLFDHHPHGTKPSKCATDLVADYLQISEDRTYRQILDYIRMPDLKGPMSTSIAAREVGIRGSLISDIHLLEQFSFHSVFSNIRSYLDAKPLIKWTCKQLDCFYENVRSFWGDVGTEFDSLAAIHQIINRNKVYKVAVIESNIRRVGSFSRTLEGGQCSVCIHKEPRTGYVFISGNIRSDQFLEIAKFLRVWEMQARNILTSDNMDLISSKFDLCPIWYIPTNIDDDAFIIMNGGEKASDVSPTELSTETILKAVNAGLKEDLLEENCPKNRCLGKICPFYSFHLMRCHIIAKLEQLANNTQMA